MITRRGFLVMLRRLGTLGAALVSLASCAPKGKAMSHGELKDFAAQYAAAWSGKDPIAFGAFYEEDGTLTVNGSPSVGRPAITATARSYMAAKR